MKICALKELIGGSLELSELSGCNAPGAITRCMECLWEIVLSQIASEVVHNSVKT